MTTPAPDTGQNAVTGALDYLSQLPADLASAYPRLAHRGRLEQIGQVSSSLRGLIAQLPDEEIRESEFEDRLVAAQASGNFAQEPHPVEYGFTHTQTAAERLAVLTGNGG